MTSIAGMTVEVSQRFPAPPDRVWALLTDVQRMAGLGPEHSEAEWLDPGPALGARFTGRNLRAGRDWTLACLVDVWEPPYRFGWVVGEPDVPSSVWRYELSGGDDGSTLATHTFRHGPGFTFLRRAVEKYPDREAEFVAGRAAELEANMRASLTAAAALL